MSKMSGKTGIKKLLNLISAVILPIKIISTDTDVDTLIKPGIYVPTGDYFSGTIGYAYGPIIVIPILYKSDKTVDHICQIHISFDDEDYSSIYYMNNMVYVSGSNPHKYEFGKWKRLPWDKEY